MDEQPRVPGQRRWRVSEQAVQAALALVLIGLGMAVGVAWYRRTRAPAVRRVPTPLLPESLILAPIWDSWRAADDGDLEKFLACFTGPAREKLAAELASQGREEFLRRIRQSTDGTRSITLGPPERSEEALRVFRVKVQREKEIELLDYTVVQVGKDWKISAVESRGRRPAE